MYDTLLYHNKNNDALWGKMLQKSEAFLSQEQQFSLGHTLTITSPGVIPRVHDGNNPPWERLWSDVTGSAHVWQPRTVYNTHRPLTGSTFHALLSEHMGEKKASDIERIQYVKNHGTFSSISHQQMKSVTKRALKELKGLLHVQVQVHICILWPYCDMFPCFDVQRLVDLNQNHHLNQNWVVL